MGAIVIDGPNKQDIRIRSGKRKDVEVESESVQAKPKWGDIGGDIENQQDLQEAFARKADLEHKHTTDDVMLADDDDVSLTTELINIWKYAKKNRKLAKAAL